MKTMISSIGMIILLFITTMIHNNIINYTSRTNELNYAINNAVVDTQRVLYDSSYKINNSDEYVAEFTQNLIQYINSDSEIEVRVYSADEMNGLLDIEVVGTYKNVANGNEKQYKVRRASIVDKFINSDFNENLIKDNYTLSFEMENNVQLDLSDVNFFIPKEVGVAILEIPIISGVISDVHFNGISQNTHSVIIKNSKPYLRLELTDIKSDIQLKIK